MKAGMLRAAAAVLAIGAAAGLSSMRGYSQVEPQKRPGPVSRPDSAASRAGTAEPGTLGASADNGVTSPLTEVDSTMRRMDFLVARAEALSKSFGALAELHHGADKSEILMMQRMSDAMGAMAGEVRRSLEQYKKMLDDETASESGTMRAEVQSLKGVMDVIAGEVDRALQTLQRLEAQLGQG